jgi:hypothetical protein
MRFVLRAAGALHHLHHPKADHVARLERQEHGGIKRGQHRAASLNSENAAVTNARHVKKVRNTPELL